MTTFALLALVGAAVVKATDFGPVVELKDVGPSVEDGKASLKAGKPKQELLKECGLDRKAWGHHLNHIWPDKECPNIGMRGPEIDGTRLDLEECKELCLTTKTCNAVNYNAEKVTCVMRTCKAYKHATNHNTWSNSGWVGFRMKMTKPEIEAALVKCKAPPAPPVAKPPATEAGAFAAAAKKEGHENEEEAFEEEESPDFEAAEAATAKKEAANGDSFKEEEKAFAQEEEAAEKQAAKEAPPAFSYSDVFVFSNCYETPPQTVRNKALRGGVSFSVFPALPDGITLDSTTGTISGTYNKHVPKGKASVVKDLAFIVTATLSGMETTHHLRMKLDESHCTLQPAQPPYFWMAVAAAALLLCCFVGLLALRKEPKDQTPVEPGPEYVPLKKQATEVEEVARIKNITANCHDNPPPRPAPPPAPVHENGDTWMLKGKEHPKGQSQEFADKDAPPGQVGCASTWDHKPGCALTFH
jgi:hypothetical protein